MWYPSYYIFCIARQPQYKILKSDFNRLCKKKKLKKKVTDTSASQDFVGHVPQTLFVVAGG